MYEVILHQHLEESGSTETGNHCIQRMHVLLEVSHWHSFDKTLHEDRVSGLLLKGYGKVNVFVVDEMLVEGDKVVLLNIEVYLIDQCLL